MANKTTALKILSARLPDPEFLPTASFGINRALGGEGLEAGRIHVYWGPKASGKTSMSFHQIRMAQDQGKKCVYWDSEKAFSMKWAQKCGVDVDALGYLRTNSAEKGLVTPMPHVGEGRG
jgi:recombination protein RecA